MKKEITKEQVLESWRTLQSIGKAEMTFQIHRNTEDGGYKKIEYIKEIIKENWEDSTFRNYLDDTRFFFVVYKYDNQGILRLKGCQFWSIPYNDLENNVKNVWLKTCKVINEGIKVTEINGKIYNNFPSPSENPVCHVRPHARNKDDTYELPNGGSFTKQCFWLNNSYILSQIDDNLK